MTTRLLLEAPVQEANNPERDVSDVARTLLPLSDINVRFLLTDDDSGDGGLMQIERICRQNPAFSALRLSRNFSFHFVQTARLDNARYDVDVVITLACDLQDPPEVLLQYFEAWRGGASIACGRRQAQQDRGWRRLVSMLFEKPHLAPCNAVWLARRALRRSSGGLSRRRPGTRRPSTFKILAPDDAASLHQKSDVLAKCTGWQMVGN